MPNLVSLIETRQLKFTAIAVSYEPKIKANILLFVLRILNNFLFPVMDDFLL